MITKAITLKHGFMVGGNAHKDIVLREPTLGDMMAAEEEAPVYNQIAFRAALACRCIEKVDGFDGVITLNMMRALKPADWRIIAKAVDDMEAAGNA